MLVLVRISVAEEAASQARTEVDEAREASRQTISALEARVAHLNKVHSVPRCAFTLHDCLLTVVRYTLTLFRPS